jgi:hypothetical protein
MYLDKLDGRIDNDFFDRKAAEFRSEQSRLMRDMETHQNANQSYIEDGIRLLQLAQQAHQLFENQPPSEKRKLLDFVHSDCRWKDGQLVAEYRTPFDMLAVAVAADQQGMIGRSALTGQNEIWLPKKNPVTNTRLENPEGAGFSGLLTPRGDFGFASHQPHAIEDERLLRAPDRNDSQGAPRLV